MRGRVKEIGLLAIAATSAMPIHPPPSTLSLTTSRVEARGTATSTRDEVCVAYFRVFVFMLLNVNNLRGG